MELCFSSRTSHNSHNSHAFVPVFDPRCYAWTGFPNSSDYPKDAGCPDCCLFNIIEDPTETKDLRTTEPQVFAKLQAELESIGKTVSLCLSRSGLVVASVVVLYVAVVV